MKDDDEIKLDESDDGGESEDDEITGATEKKNYISEAGYKELQAEYQKLFHEERPKLVETISWAASNGDRSENGDYIYGKRRLREIDRRLKFLGRRMAIAVIVKGANQPKDRVLFGARVTVEDENGKELYYQIVGEDETDISARKISWVSPIAKSLMGGKVGEVVTVQRPHGTAELTILKIEYPHLE